MMTTELATIENLESKALSIFESKDAVQIIFDKFKILILDNFMVTLSKVKDSRFSQVCMKIMDKLFFNKTKRR